MSTSVVVRSLSATDKTLALRLPQRAALCNAFLAPHAPRASAVEDGLGKHEEFAPSPVVVEPNIDPSIEPNIEDLRATRH